MASSSLPVNNGMSSFWRSEPYPLDDYRSTETIPEICDIVVVGAGYAGVSAAYHCLNLADTGTKPSILILEARQACSGATGRNGGHLRPDVYDSIGTWAAEYGVDAAAEVAAFEAENLEAVKSLVEEKGIDCDFVMKNVFDMQYSEDYCSKLRAGLRLLDTSRLELSDRVSFMPQETMEAATGVKGSIGCYSSRAARLWPYKLVMQLLRHVVSAGANLQTHTPVSSVSERQSSDQRLVVTTPRGVIRARWVIFASNAYTSAIVPEYRDTIVPVRGTCCRIVAPNPPAKALQSSYTFRFSKWDYDYLIPRPDGSIVVGGAKSAYIEDSDSWYDNVDDSQQIDSARRYFDGYMQRHFYGWEYTGAYTDQIWTGIMAYTADSLPHVGYIPHKHGQLVIAGFNGHGMPQIFLSARAIARMILEGVTYEETDLPRLFKSTATRLRLKVNKKDIRGE